MPGAIVGRGFSAADQFSPTCAVAEIGGVVVRATVVVSTEQASQSAAAWAFVKSGLGSASVAMTGHDLLEQFPGPRLLFEVCALFVGAAFGREKHSAQSVFQF
ncbi:MAG: hypothetical protein BGN84_18235 [Afipia sp. 62-7]|nr:MAG: hypothetical protein BGN84_18235 [Afipia sp. 62-7]